MFPAPVKEDSPLDPAYIRTRLHLILEHAQCKQIRFHDLRHTFATIALGNGMDVKTLSAMPGHVSAATTLDIYTHITNPMRSEAAAKIDQKIGKAAPQELPAREADDDHIPALCRKETEARHRLYHPDQRKLLGGTLLPNVAGRQKALP